MSCRAKSKKTKSLGRTENPCMVHFLSEKSKVNDETNLEVRNHHFPSKPLKIYKEKSYTAFQKQNATRRLCELPRINTAPFCDSSSLCKGTVKHPLGFPRRRPVSSAEIGNRIKLSEKIQSSYHSMDILKLSEMYNAQKHVNPAAILNGESLFQQKVDDNLFTTEKTNEIALDSNLSSPVMLTNKYGATNEETIETAGGDTFLCKKLTLAGTCKLKKSQSSPNCNIEKNQTGTGDIPKEKNFYKSKKRVPTNISSNKTMYNKPLETTNKISTRTEKDDKRARSTCILTCIKPNNVEEEKHKFIKSNFTYNPQFDYDIPASESTLSRYNEPSTCYLPMALSIIHRVLERYGCYSKFEAATGGRLLSRTDLWKLVKNYLKKEGFYGHVIVNITDKLVSRASMTINGGRPTLSIRENVAKVLWVEGLLRHEIGTHHLRFHNNRQQIWSNMKTRREMNLKPANPTEEGLASLHSVLLRKDPSLWRSAILYYTAFKASTMSFCELFKDLEKFVEDVDVRWDYCLRTKRGQRDTSQPGGFCKDQVYLNGIIPLLRARRTLDFQHLCLLGKIAHEDVERLKPHYNAERTKLPYFMTDLDQYRRHLNRIVAVNGLEDWLESPPDPSPDDNR